MQHELFQLLGDLKKQHQQLLRDIHDTCVLLQRKLYFFHAIEMNKLYVEKKEGSKEG
jgi:hypothetical protein